MPQKGKKYSAPSLVSSTVKPMHHRTSIHKNSEQSMPWTQCSPPAASLGTLPPPAVSPGTLPSRVASLGPLQPPRPLRLPLRSFAFQKFSVFYVNVTYQLLTHIISINSFASSILKSFMLHLHGYRAIFDFCIVSHCLLCSKALLFAR